MIRVEIREEIPGRQSKCLCGIKGNLKTLTRETIEVVHAIYKAMAEDGSPPEALLLFQARVVMALADPHSPVWDLSGGVSTVDGKVENWPGTWPPAGGRS